MSRNEIITTAEDRANVPLDIYEYPTEPGEFVGTLTYRAWHPKSSCLLCFFDTFDGRYYKLASWWNNNYTPRKSQVNFADDVKNGSRWKCSFTKATGGSMTWITATPY